MKRILATALALCLALPLTACADGKAPSSSGSGEGQAPAGAYLARNVNGIVQWGAGGIRFLCLLAEEPVELMPEAPLITAEYPGFAKYLPWGPFYGIFVKEGTDASVTETLSSAFQAVGTDAGYQELLANFNINFLGYTGSEASDYIAAWRENTINALRNSGALN